ncbi:SRPBCC domain-containing protein [Leptospira gomenensis]|uniref:SRPBCC domain-containing protein n=1 Tax=Leptospira gomenensis TaxID=2484974 RepID=A0A5F1Y8G4_9LEPT|nr:SRPBCC domain-containing protein [Leptospira gomenensis]TGK29440.1 SRPBCC domain-containing protein [Leptospira gomenensis]TGK33657.1 SRPBCC domain-containing protein [Leptospira gomenensis]TGK44898.1 SRPBCC domain-containing protein [Leptospira gomenensis]TGK64519.1 SRPBCC domain-containing protein [Leptospira gomenensis]
MDKTNGIKNEMVIVRIFDAPRELVFKAWTEPERLMSWWGPKDFSSPGCKLEPRVGGKYHFGMRSPEGQEFWSSGKFLEFVPPEKIVFTDHFADKDGNPVPASYYGMPDFPEELIVSVHFEELDGKTKMTVRHAGLPAGEMSEMTEAGWNQSFDKLAAALSGK